MQRQCRNTARAEGTNYGHSSTDRALCNCTVDFDWQPERSPGFCNRVKDFGLSRGLRPPTKQPLTFATAHGAFATVRDTDAGPSRREAFVEEKAEEPSRLLARGVAFTSLSALEWRLVAESLRFTSAMRFCQQCSCVNHSGQPLHRGYDEIPAVERIKLLVVHHAPGRGVEQRI